MTGPSLVEVDGTRPPAEIDRLARAAADVHARAATKAYAHIFPADSTPPTAEQLTPLWSDMMADRRWTVVVAIEPVVAGPEGERPEPLVVGAAGVGPDTAVPTGLVLAKLYVDPDRWSVGLGSQLHDEVCRRRYDESVGINLWVLEANLAARRFYESRGWRLVPNRFLGNDAPEIRDVLYQRGPE